MTTELAGISVSNGNSIPRVSQSELEIQSLLKGLRIIEAINQHPGMILAQIAVRCGLPRTTAHRALRTLEQNGFVFREAATSRFYAHHRVLRLSNGFDALAQLTARAREQFAEVGPQIGWPLHLTTPDVALDSPQMHVQASSDHVSALAVDKLLPGQSIPVLQCAAGLAWLSSIPSGERSPIVERAMRNPCERAAQTRWTAATLEEKLVKAQYCGYADFRWPLRHTNMVGLSIPVRTVGLSTAALSVRFAETAVSLRDAVARFLPVLRVIASRLDAPAARHTPI